MGEQKIQIDPSWHRVLSEEFNKPYFAELSRSIKEEMKAGKIIYPKGKDIFAAFNYTPFENVKAVILGQDPYHGEGQAHGLSFSVPEGVEAPPSLRNIFQEVRSDLQTDYTFSSGDLTAWAKQGVLLLNASLTVRKAEPMSHAKMGWAFFTDAAIAALSDKLEHVVFMLWGKFAGEKRTLVDEKKHCVLTAAHPSPLSASQGFYGCKHFSKANAYLRTRSKSPIEWLI